MSNARGKAVDNTHLSIDQAEQRGFIHRDYLAHCLRWSHVMKDLGIGQAYKNSRILDVGCGKDVAFAKTLYSSRFIVEHFLGVDVNKPSSLNMQPFHTGRFPIDVFGSTDFADDEDVQLDLKDNELIVNGQCFKMPNILTCFEVIEHVEPKHAIGILNRMLAILKLGKGTAYISTPCYDAHVGAAANHVNEITHEALGAKLEDLGFYIEGVWGTFASIRDYKHRLAEQEGLPELFEKLRAYYDVNYLATVFAPLFPSESRNCLWKLKATTSDNVSEPPKFRSLHSIQGPWGSSEKWEEWNDG